MAATSATNAWAVGDYFNNANRSQTLIVHWNGTGWKQQASPNPGSAGTAFNTLSGVVATSPTNAWAVGSYNNGNGTPTQTLILHWNGTTWKQVPSPNPGGRHASVLSGVAATSATNAWAVGTDVMFPDSESITPVTLIVHWNGTKWQQQTSPRFNNSGLGGVAATSATNAWAVGNVGGGTLIAHWTGTAWKLQSSPNPGSASNALSGVAATSATNAWAVGNYSNGGTFHTLALHCC